MSKGIVIAIASILILSTAVMGVSADTAMIWTDKDDYSPGETVTIYGSGFNPNAEINITIFQPNGELYTTTAYSDNDGSFTAYYEINNDEPVGLYKQLQIVPIQHILHLLMLLRLVV